MKTYFIILGLCLVTATGFAQTFGKAVVTGSFHFASYSGSTQQESFDDVYFKQGDSKNTSLGIQPGFAFFVKDKLAIGGTFSYNYYQNKSSFYDKDTYQKRHTVSVGPLARYYIPVSNRIAFFCQASLTYVTGKENRKDLTNISTVTVSSGDLSGGAFKIYPGLTFFATPKLGIELTFGDLGYETEKLDSDHDSLDKRDTSFGANFDFTNLGIGISLYLGRTASE